MFHAPAKVWPIPRIFNLLCNWFLGRCFWKYKFICNSISTHIPQKYFFPIVDDLFNILTKLSLCSILILLKVFLASFLVMNKLKLGSCFFQWRHLFRKMKKWKIKWKKIEILFIFVKTLQHNWIRSFTEIYRQNLPVNR